MSTTSIAENSSKIKPIEDQDAWKRDVQATIRAGLRVRNLVDFGGLQVGRVENNVILTDGGWNEFPIPFSSEAEAITEFQRISSGINRGMTISELLPNVDLPIEIKTAWVN